MARSLSNVFSRSQRVPDNPAIFILGLGRFGSALAEELSVQGVDVIGIDSNPRLVHECNEFLAEAATGDTTDREVLKQLGVHEVETVVLGIGSDLESSILTASHLVDLNVPDIWAKADSDAHAKILTQIGVHHVVRPERDTGRRVAHLLFGGFKDYAQFDEDYGMIKVGVPEKFVGSPVDLDDMWERFQVRAVSLRGDDGQWVPIKRSCVLNQEDQIIVAGTPHRLEQFARRHGRTGGV
ncbi:TrkA family potassium uptake protein [Corynebacterium bovis]|uniref:potassium channel family protein n=1 Tax=Corynebacterium bovis TaxID=36808 RepID=UPI0031386F34